MKTIILALATVAALATSAQAGGYGHSYGYNSYGYNSYGYNVLVQLLPSDLPDLLLHAVLQLRLQLRLLSRPGISLRFRPPLRAADFVWPLLQEYSFDPPSAVAQPWAEALAGERETRQVVAAASLRKQVIAA